MNWHIIKTFPKYALMVAVLVISTGLFAWWYFFKFSMPTWGFAKPDPAKQEEIRKKAEDIPRKLGWLALVGGDLYDVSSGELIFPNWVRGIPNRVFYYPGSNHIMVQTDRGILRYGLDGCEAGAMGVGSPPAFTTDGKLAIYVKDGDIWVADVDWTNFKYTNERQATKYGQFDAHYFSVNAWLTSEKACYVRVNNSAIRADLLTGDIKQVPLLVAVPTKFRSPDCRVLAFSNGEGLTVNDIDKPDTVSVSTNGRKVNIYRWVNNDVLALTFGASQVSMYDRKKNEIIDVKEFEGPVYSLEKPSPDGRYIIASVKKELVLIDLIQKSSEPLNVVADHLEWIANDTIIFSREIPDTKLRGTWIKKVGGEETRVLPEPYVTNYDKSGSVALLPELNVVVLATQRALFTMKINGSDLKEISKLTRPVGRIQPVENWGL